MSSRHMNNSNRPFNTAIPSLKVGFQLTGTYLIYIYIIIWQMVTSVVFSTYTQRLLITTIYNHRMLNHIRVVESRVIATTAWGGGGRRHLIGGSLHPPSLIDNSAGGRKRAITHSTRRRQCDSVSRHYAYLRWFSSLSTERVIPSLVIHPHVCYVGHTKLRVGWRLVIKQLSVNTTCPWMEAV
jgi:hypothetical protein